MTPLSTHQGARYGLVWSLKKSFIGYIARMPDGKVSVTDGATLLDGNMFSFSHVAHADDPLRFRGDVRFAGHHGLLFVSIADPEIIVQDDRATVTLQHLGTPEQPGKRFAFATATLSRLKTGSEGTGYLGTEVRLTDEGSFLFAGVYSPGEPMDNFAMTVPDRSGRATPAQDVDR